MKEKRKSSFGAVLVLLLALTVGVGCQWKRRQLLARYEATYAAAALVEPFAAVAGAERPVRFARAYRGLEASNFVTAPYWCWELSQAAQ